MGKREEKIHCRSRNPIIHRKTYHSKAVSFYDVRREYAQVLHNVPGNLIGKAEAQAFVRGVSRKPDMIHGHLPEDDPHPLLGQEEVCFLELRAVARNTSNLLQARMHGHEVVMSPLRHISVHGLPEVLKQPTQAYESCEDGGILINLKRGQFWIELQYPREVKPSGVTSGSCCKSASV